MAFAPAVLGRGKYLRPTSVGPGRFGGRGIGIQVVGLREVVKLPAQYERAYALMLERLRDQLQDAARKVVPGGPTGTLGKQVHARLYRNRITLGTEGSQFAAALNRGFTSTPKRARALRFDEGQTLVFTKRVRVAGRHFYEEWVELTPPIVEAVYEQSFYNVKDLA